MHIELFIIFNFDIAHILRDSFVVVICPVIQFVHRQIVNEETLMWHIYKAREIMKTFSNLEDISLIRYDIWYTLDRIYDSKMVAVPSQLREIAQILIFQLEVVSLVKAHEFNSTLISSSGAQSVSWCKCSIVLPWCSGNVSISVMPPSHLTLKY